MRFLFQGGVSQLVARILTLSWVLLILWFAQGRENDQVSLIERLDYLIYDLRFPLAQARFAKQASTPVIIIDIDESSLAELGQWPWSRVVMADLVQSAYSAGVAMIGFDIVFSEPEKDSVTTWLNRKELTEFEAAFAQHWQAIWQPEQVFSDAMGGETILGYVFHDVVGVEQGKLPASLVLKEQTNLASERLTYYEMPNYTSNLAVLMDSALSAGFFNSFPDKDGIVRRVPLVLGYQNQLYSSLALELVRQFWLMEEISLATVDLGHEKRVESLGLGQYSIPTDARAQVLVPYVGGAKSFPYISASDFILRPDQLPTAELEGAIALVGTSAMGLEDLRATPMGTEYPGVEVHANVINAILNTLDGNAQFPYRPDIAKEISLFLIVVVGFLALFLSNLTPRTLLLTLLGSGALMVGGNLAAWRYELVDLPLASLLLLRLGLCVINLPICFIGQSLQRMQLQKMFGQYVPSAHIKAMMANEESYGFDGETKPMTVMFSDIRDFTSLSESLSAQELKDLLNRYFTPITEVIFNYKGTIDKYVGDMVMAFWGAPMEDEEHANHAVGAALTMLEVVDQLQVSFRDIGLPPINVGIGLNTGDMNVGDMGSTYRRAYTVLGDAVNLGSRLEGLTKFYGVRILVSESTKNKAIDFVYRKVDCLRVKGKKEPVTVFEPVGNVGDVLAETLDEIRAFEACLELYYQQAWLEAEEGLVTLQKQAPEEKLYQVYLDRIQQLKKRRRFDESWDGVYTHTSK